MSDRDLPIPFFPRYIWPYEDAAEGERADTEHEQSAVTVPTQRSRSTRVHHHRTGHVGEVSGEYTEGHDEI